MSSKAYEKACRDIDKMDDVFLIVVWEAINKNDDPPTHRDGLLWQDWVNLVYSEMGNRNLSTQ